MDTNIDNNHSYSRLPQKIPIKKLGREFIKLEGYVKIGGLARVEELLVEQSNQQNDESIFISLTFGLTEKYQVIVEGVVNQCLALLCQRCHQKIKYPISSTIKIILVKELDKLTEQFLNNKYGEYEPIVVSYDDMLDLYQIIEDEIILALPIVIKHDDDNVECKNYSNFTI